MSKAHDETIHTASDADADATPAPVRSVVDDGSGPKHRDGAASRRPRSVPPRERSGPIGIASGDFATPTVRRRTITQPRGTPALGVPLSGAAAHLQDALTPPPEVPLPPPSAPPSPPPAAPPVAVAPPPPPPAPAPVVPPPVSAAEIPPVGATPVDLVDGTSGQAPMSVPPMDNPFGPEPGSGAADNEAAILAAEAAAVRALDSGPLTPPPEVMVPGPTPPPLPKAPPPSPVATGSGATPPPAPAKEVEGPVPVDLAADQLTPAPQPLRPAPEQDVAGAVPVRPMGSEGSAASSDLVNAVGTPTPAPDASLPASLAPPEADDELQGADELEVDEADGAPSDGTAPGAPAARPAPPPIPGSYLKTPGPELKITTPPPAPALTAEAHGPLLPALPILPEALTQRPRRPKRSKPWFEEVFDEDYLRTLPFMRADQTLREVEFVSGALNASSGAEILDVGCGYGRHAIEMVQRGFNVTGLDLSLPLLIRAADEAQRRSLTVNFVHADMREMAFEKQFDGAYSMLTSFGYFDEETNLRVAERIARALKPGGRFLLDIVNRDYVVADLPVRVWWEGTGCVVLEEVDFNFHTSRINTHRSIVFEDGRQLEQELSVRAYSLHEIGRLLRQAGFRVIDVSGNLATRGDFFGSASRNLFIVAEKREEE
ncbi:MAG TPA: class I SAM-dependent methyltransferase [Polyangia bacterium]|nr:class I SAM-dependent methyltransferase [Polyangia bacterium]